MPLLDFAHAEAPRAQEGWSLSGLSGRLIELCGASASLTLTLGLVREAQRLAEPAAWLTGGQRCFFPPDAAEGGVDLDALVVVRAPDSASIARAADQLARSGAFGLLVLDLGAGGPVSMPLLSRLLGLAQKHDIAVVFLTDGAQPLGSLISLRAEARRSPLKEGGFVCELMVLKDKRRAPGWTHHEVCRGPIGLR
jgi:recombination protein RecA